MRHRRVRVVRVRATDGTELVLVTNLGPAELPAELVSLLYRRRWPERLGSDRSRPGGSGCFVTPRAW